jgi:hypothetical protein
MFNDHVILQNIIEFNTSKNNPKSPSGYLVNNVIDVICKSGGMSERNAFWCQHKLVWVKQCDVLLHWSWVIDFTVIR